MKQKYFKWIQVAVMLIFALYFYIKDDKKPTEHQPKSKPEQVQKQTEKSKTEKAKEQNKTAVENQAISAIPKNYDFIMRNDAIGQNTTAPVDSYRLALSWSPLFCDEQREKFGKNLPANSQMQCGIEKKYGWVIHGLWPQNSQARSTSDHPRFCQGDLPQLPVSQIAPYLAESPSANLLQAQWEKHGACAFDSAEKYFKKQQDLYRGLTLPNQMMNKKELFRWVKQHNPELKNVYLGASRSELFICYDLGWNPINCK